MAAVVSVCGAPLLEQGEGNTPVLLQSEEEGGGIRCVVPIFNAIFIVMFIFA